MGKKIPHLYGAGSRENPECIYRVDEIHLIVNGAKVINIRKRVWTF